MIKSNSKFYLALIILLTSVLLLIFNSPRSITLNDIHGTWKGSYKNNNIILRINLDSTCILEVGNIESSESYIYNGECSLDNKKFPYSFMIKNISETSDSLYSILMPINNNAIKITQFSNKWRLRQVTLTKKNTFTINKINK